MRFLYLLPIMLLLTSGCVLFPGSNSNSVANNNNNPPVTPAPKTGDLTFSPEKLPGAEVGKPYKVGIEVSGNRTPVGGVSISEGSLPEGLVFEDHPGEGKIAEINGTPQKAGKFKVKISVWCYGTQVSGQSGNIEYELETKEPGKNK